MYKVVIIGDTGAGKTNIVTKYINDYFDGVSRPTIGVEFFQKELSLESSEGLKSDVKLQIWDTAGQERFRGMASSYYRKAFGVLLVYDITNRESFINLDKWLEEVHSYTDSGIEMMLIGNKKDLVHERQVTTEEGLDFSKRHNLLFYETSALRNEDKLIEELFNTLARRIHQNAGSKVAKESTTENVVKKQKNLHEVVSRPQRRGPCC